MWMIPKAIRNNHIKKQFPDFGAIVASRALVKPSAQCLLRAPPSSSWKPVLALCGCKVLLHQICFCWQSEMKNRHTRFMCFVWAAGMAFFYLREDNHSAGACWQGAHSLSPSSCRSCQFRIACRNRFSIRTMFHFGRITNCDPYFRTSISPCLLIHLYQK